MRFVLPDGRQVHRRAPDTPVRAHHRPGDEVRVAFQPADPGSSTAGEPRRVLVTPVLVVLFGVFFGGIAAVLAAVAASLG